MFDLRWGLIPGISALVLSVMLGIITGVGIFYVFIRALVFAAVFFGLGIGTRFIINSFFPELLYGSEDEHPGSHINITVGSAGEYALPEAYRGGSKEQELGNIEDLISGVFRPRSGIDRKTEDDYNESTDESESEIKEFKFPDLTPDIQPSEAEPEEIVPSEKPVFNPSFGDDSGGLGGLPDLDSMVMAFTTGAGGDFSSNPQGSANMEEAGAEMPRERRTTGNKPQTLQGDFNAEDLAKGIRTVLSKDSK